jgi:hypothetical protein
MSQTVLFNGSNYTIPDVGDNNWGQNVTDYLVGIANGSLQKTGGAFSLTGDVDFGSSFGLKSLYYKSRTASGAQSGVMRLARTDSVAWRNQADGADLLLGVDSSNRLTFNGVVLESDTLPSGQIFVGNASNESTAVPMTGHIGITNTGLTSIQNDVITNLMVNSSAAIAYSKLNLATSIVNGDISASAAIAYSKLNLATSIVNGDISNSAAIAYSKLALALSIVNGDISASAAIAYSKLNLALSIVNGDISASAAIAYSKLNLATSIVNGDIAAGAVIAYSKLAALTASKMLTSDGSGFVSATSWGYASNNVTTNSNGELRFTDGTTNYVAIKSPAAVTTHTYLLPIAVGTVGQVLTYATGGQLEWTSAGGGSGTILSGVAGRFTYYPATGTTVDDQTALLTDGSTYVAIPATNKLYFDGGADTYIHESSANVLNIRVGGVSTCSIDATSFGVGLDLVIQPTKIFYLDGGGDTYIYEGVANNVYFKAGGAFVSRWNPTSFFSYQDLIVDATKKIYLDGGSDSYFVESAANIVRLYTGGNLNMIFEGSVRTECHAAYFSVNGLAKIYLGGSYLVESAASILNVFCGVYNELTVDGINHGTVLRASSKLWLDGTGGVGGDTYINEASANYVTMVVGGNGLLACTPTGFYVGQDLIIEPAKKFYLDGGSDTYIWESAGNVVKIYTGANESLRITSAYLYCGTGDVVIEQGAKLRTDGLAAGDTYLSEVSANGLRFTVGGVSAVDITSTFFQCDSGINFVIQPTAKFYLDGGGDTYIYESAANVVKLYCGAVLNTQWTTTLLNPLIDVAIEATKKLYFDGGSDTYLVESAANVLDVYTAGNRQVTFYGNGQVFIGIAPTGFLTSKLTVNGVVACGGVLPTGVNLDDLEVWHSGGLCKVSINSASNDAIQIWKYNGSSGLINTLGAFDLVFGTNGTAGQFTIKNGGNLGFWDNGTVGYGGGALVVSVRNTVTAPTSNPVGGGLFYADGGAGKWRGSGGTVTTFGPAEPHCPTCGTDYMHEWDNKEYGHFAICMNCLAKELGNRPWIIKEKSRLN